MAMSFRFSERGGVVAALEVHDPEHDASLEELYNALLELRVQVVSASELEVEGRTVFELCVCELDGGKVTPARRRAVISELSALRAEARGAESTTGARATKKSRRAA